MSAMTDPASRTYRNPWIALKLHYVPGYRINSGTGFAEMMH
jgi:hypothetical protein